MKMRTLKLAAEDYLKALRGKFSVNLPADVELLDLRFDLSQKQVVAIIRSDSFEDILEAIPIPEWNPKPQEKSVAPQQTLTRKVEPKIMDIKSPAAKVVPVVQNQDTGKLEEEFAPEQRKLLKFVVEGDFVKVKPIQFLKTEWEDINDVVKSLGGRWVKGDIINYWEVPRIK
jgi:hypothetical protein